jgi:hypothetical protein
MAQKARRICKDQGTKVYVLSRVLKEIQNNYNVAGRRTRRETDRLCSDNEAGGGDGKAER